MATLNAQATSGHPWLANRRQPTRSSIVPAPELVNPYAGKSEHTLWQTRVALMATIAWYEESLALVRRGNPQARAYGSLLTDQLQHALDVEREDLRLVDAVLREREGE